MRHYLYILTGIVAVAFSGMLGFSLYSDYRGAVAQEQARLSVLVHLIADNADGVIERNRGRLTRMAKRPAIRAMNANGCDAILSDFVELFPEFANLTTIDKTGLVPCSGVPQPGGKPISVAKTEWFKRALAEQRFIVGNPFIGPITGRLVSVLIEPVRDEQRELLGFIGMPLDLERFSLRIHEESLPEGTRFGLLAADGTLVWRNTDPEKLIGKKVNDSPALRQALSIKNGQFEAQGHDGVNRYFTVAAVSEPDWVAYMSVPTKTITQQVMRTILLNALVGLTALIGLGILLAYFLRRIKQVEVELLRTRDAAEAASRAKSAFLSNMSHELRTPMNGVIGMTKLALRHATDPKLIDQLTKVTDASHHLLNLLNDILDISKIEAGHLTLDSGNFRLGEITENLLSLIGDKAQEKGLKLQIDLDTGLSGLLLSGDALRLEQILLNLVGNAVKFTEKGMITVRVRLVDNAASAVRLRFEIQDTGIGISDENKARLFAAFEQADGSTTRKYGGTGLGLAISKRLTQMMDGEIGVDSTEGLGSTFWFTVQIAKGSETVVMVPDMESHSAEESIKTQFAGARILLVEDEPINQEVSRALLEDVGLQVDLAEDGLQAVALAKQNVYALILMDMQMPNMNGVDATQLIRTLPMYQTTPILALTANAFGEDRQVCIRAGMNDYIAKPVEPETLFKTLLTWLERTRPR